MANLSLTKKIIGSLLSVAAAAPVSWEIYKLIPGQELTIKAKDTPETLLLKNFKGISKGDYGPGTFGEEIILKEHGLSYLETSKESKPVWEAFFKVLDKKFKDGGYSTIWGVTYSFSEEKDEKSLNGKCESLYKGTAQKGRDAKDWSWICSPRNAIDDD